MARTSEAELRKQYEARRPHLEKLRLTLEDSLTTALDDLPHVDRVSVRVKDTKSFVSKVLQRIGEDNEYVSPFEDVEDQVAARILVFFTTDLKPVEDRIQEWLAPVEFQRKKPELINSFDYETDHIIVTLPDVLLPDDHPTPFVKRVEIQVRTLMQHAYAEPQHDLNYKATTPLSDEQQRRLAWIAASAWGADNAYETLATELGLA